MAPPEASASLRKWSMRSSSRRMVMRVLPFGSGSGGASSGLSFAEIHSSSICTVRTYVDGNGRSGTSAPHCPGVLGQFPECCLFVDTWIRGCRAMRKLVAEQLIFRDRNKLWMVRSSRLRNSSYITSQLKRSRIGDSKQIGELLNLSRDPRRDRRAYPMESDTVSFPPGLAS